MPYTSKDMPRVAKCLLIENIEKNPWIPYRDDGNTQERIFEQPSNVRTVHRYLCELSEIIHDSLYEFYTPSGNLTSTSLLEVYSHHLAWKGSLPEPCHLGAAPMPVVLYLQYANSLILSKNKSTNLQLGKYLLPFCSNYALQTLYQAPPSRLSRLTA
jgi:hypothetical protein